MLILRFLALLGVSWVVMTFTHECGHLIAGAVAGATLQEFELAPWKLPYSLHSPDPRPLITLWGGPLLGAGLPMLVASFNDHRWVRFVANFCLLANGIYLALAWVSGDAFLDTPRLLEAGCPTVLILLYCVVTIGVGYPRFRRDCIECLRNERQPVPEAE